MSRPTASLSHPEPGQRGFALVEQPTPGIPEAWRMYVGDLYDVMLRAGEACIALDHAHRAGDVAAMQAAVNVIRAEAGSATNLAGYLSRHVSGFRTRTTRVR